MDNINKQVIRQPNQGLDLSTPVTILIYGQPESGKTTLAYSIINKINYDHCMVVTGSPEDSFLGFPIVMDNYDNEIITEFIRRDGIKLLILDDISGFEFTKKKAIHLGGIVTRTQHNKTYVIVILHRLAQENLKVVRLSSRLTFLGIIDEDSIKIIKNRTGLSVSKIRDIRLDQYQFLFINKVGALSKVSSGGAGTLN